MSIMSCILFFFHFIVAVIDRYKLYLYCTLLFSIRSNTAIKKRV